MQDSCLAVRTLPIDIQKAEEYPLLVTKDTIIMGGCEGLDSMDAADDNQITPSEPEASGIGYPPGSREPLSAYSRTRFLEAVRGIIPMDVYVQEVSEHVEKQLPGHQHI
jgi:hypothetical protein